jgi:microcystin-dependent protein
MAQPYIGEIRIFAGNFAPAGWAFCDGALQAISENETLFVVIGTTYGGDGQSTFALPDLRGRLPIHQGNSYQIGQTGGAESVLLTPAQIPAHTHTFLASTDVPTEANPQSNVPGQAAIKLYRSGVPSLNMSVAAISPAGSSQPHDNFQPYLCVTFIISLYGIFPSQT